MKAKRRSAAVADVDDAGKENLGKKAKVEEAAEQPMEAEQKLEEKPNSRSTRATRSKGTGVNYKEQRDLKLKDEDYTTVAMEVEVDAEQQALAETAADGVPVASDASAQHRRLFDFMVVDSHGTAQPLEQLSLVEGELLVSGVVQPSEGAANKSTGRRFTQPSQLKSWALVYTKSAVQIHLKTGTATYQAVRPANSYKKLYSELEEQAELMFRVYQALTPEHGGSATASFDDVVAKLARAKVGKHYGSARDALLLNAKFVTTQLAALAANQTGKAQGPTYADGPFATGLEASLKAWVAPISMMDGNSITINGNETAAHEDNNDAPAPDKQMEADAELALRLQARLDAEAAMGPSRGRPRKGAAQAYTQISESEIADDYPIPAQYSPEVEETDELLLADEDVWFMAPEDLPRCQLSDFAIYNADGFYATLELIPMWNMVDPDVELFISGVVSEDNGDWVGVQLEDDAAGAGSANGGGSSGPGEQPPAEGGMRIYSSAIKEWCVDCSCDMLRISIRTDVAWYQLTRPATKYTPWFTVVVKAAKLAVHIITMIDAQTRAAKLSFNDVVKRVTDLDTSDPNFISKKAPLVERFIVVHGQIILNQMKNYPKKAVANSAFATSLKSLMERRRHFKLYITQKKAKKVHRVNSNPMKDRSVSGRPKPMTATATLLVKHIWQNYFQLPSSGEEVKEAEPVVEVEEDVNEEDADEADQEDALAAPAAPAPKKKSIKKKAVSKSAVQWVGGSTKDSSGRTVYKAVTLEGAEVKLGTVVGIDRKISEEEEPESEREPMLGMVTFMWEQFGTKMVQLRKLVRGNETVLGDAASPYELFLTPNMFESSLTEVCTILKGHWLEREWDPVQRNQTVRKWEALCAEMKEKDEKGEMEYFWSSMYESSKGMFRCVEESEKELGTYIKTESGPEGTFWVEQGVSLQVDGHRYKVNDFVCVTASTFEPLPGALPSYDNVPEYASKGRFSKGSNLGLRAWGLAQVLEWQKGNGKGGLPRAVKLRRLWRPEDVSQQAGHKAGWWDVYWSEDTHVVDLDALITPCKVVAPGAKAGVTSGSTATYTFCCTGMFDKKKPDKLEPLSDAVKKQLSSCSTRSEAASNAGDSDPKGKGKAAADSDPKGKGKAAADSDPKGKGKAAADVDPKGKGKATGAGSGSAGVSAESAEENGSSAHAAGPEEDDTIIAPLKSMDIFAGCGGLSEGMRQAGVAESHWAIEYEEPAAEAYRLNHPHAHVWASNCNVLLLAAMRKAGMEKECVASSDAEQQASAMPADSLQQLPKPGEVEFIMGGPPCQGYSGMNRFNKGSWSLVQNSMVMAFLSYADFYRPRYFLLENVRNFVAHNKSLTFRLTLRTLLDLGYQVRFGVLNAGYYGVPQSRKRTFIWAAAPGEKLPDWPAPLHMFHSPQLTINLPDGSSFCAAPSTKGAPLRSVTVRDAISDLPEITNGHDTEEMDYQREPISAYQKHLRGSCGKLRDHVCKKLNDVNMERCRCIPKETPGADWRVLLDIVKQDPSREKFKGQPLVPWCLPNTADRHNGWRGLFGRVDLDGHFPTATTEPNPMGKVGQVFHPNQDRIVSVRECARSQGFPDSFRFYGNVHNKHRQVGNAVPPPLAFALGTKLREAIKQQQEEELQRTRAKWGR